MSTEARVALRCPACHTRFEVPADRVGSVMVCHQCDQRFRVPAKATSLSAVHLRPPTATHLRKQRFPTMVVVGSVTALIVLIVVAFLLDHYLRAQPTTKAGAMSHRSPKASTPVNLNEGKNGVSDNPEMHQFLFPEMGFAVEFPLQPNQDDQIGANPRTILRVTLANPYFRSYSVTVITQLPRDFNLEPGRVFQFANTLAESEVFGRRGKMVDRASRIDSLSDLVYTFTGIVPVPNGPKKAQLTSRIWITHRRVYLVEHEQPSNKSMDPDAERFFKSFRLLSR